MLLHSGATPAAVCTAKPDNTRPALCNAHNGGRLDFRDLFESSRVFAPPLEGVELSIRPFLPPYSP